MELADKWCVEFSLEITWRNLMRRIAVIAAAGSALTSLLFEAPVRIAATRGACAFFGCLLIGYVASLAMKATSSRAQDPPAQEVSGE